MGRISYRWRNSKGKNIWSHVDFPTDNISVRNLKSQIARFDDKLQGYTRAYNLLISDVSSGLTYDDSFEIRDKSTVVVRMIPATKSNKVVVKLNKPLGDDLPHRSNQDITSDEAKLDDIANCQSLQFKNIKEVKRSLYRPTTTTTTPHPGYICHNCQVTGHFIQDCPQPRQKRRIQIMEAPMAKRRRMQVIDMVYMEGMTSAEKLIATDKMYRDNPGGIYKLPDGRMATYVPDDSTFRQSISGCSQSSSSSLSSSKQSTMYGACFVCGTDKMNEPRSVKCCYSHMCRECFYHMRNDYRYRCKFCNSQIDSTSLIPHPSLK